ncbi:Ig-like domain-containing protein [Jonesia quinghaiensis]|uniref:Ig-like domain-containing protein n=1 Tax=Jonesia quinghaiensis TaxID=262806 RepID=UPI0009FD1E47|nr:fibronectin type III domain-containing protein [Jonesia quinghaiensis]
MSPSRMSSIAAGIAVPAVLATLAIINPGYDISDVDLNDGTVWVTNSTELKAGRFNAKVRELNGGVIPTEQRFDVLQDGQDIIMHQGATLSHVDPANMAIDVVAQMPAGATVDMFSGAVSVIDPSGSLWIKRASDLQSIDDTTPADADLADGAVATVGRDGATYAWDPSSGNVTTYVMGGAQASQTGVVELADATGIAVDPTVPALTPQITTVGTRPVVAVGTTVYTEKQSVALTSYGSTLRLADNTGAGSDVVVATDRSLLSINLDSGEVTELASGAQGVPATPVALNDCLYGAWASSSMNYINTCDDVGMQSIEGLTEASSPVFRVNRNIIVLNDVAQGRVWLPENIPTPEEPNWTEVQAPDSPDNENNNDDESEVVQSNTAECLADDRAPNANDDDLGVRAGRTTILNILGNDTVGQCGIIAVSETSALPDSFGSVEMIHAGRSLQVTVDKNATGTQEFTYTIADGRGKNPPSTATVTLTVSDEASNSAPEQIQDSRFDVEQGAQATYNVLADYLDPDGDQMVLESASLESEEGAVRASQDGILTYIADIDQQGVQQVDVVISDGTERITSTVAVEVAAAGTLPPTVDPIHHVTYVSSDVEVNVLSAVNLRSVEPARLAGVEEVAGTTITPDLDSGTFTFSAPTPGTYYVRATIVSPPHSVTGLVRIDVREWPGEPLPPVAVSDVALLPAGGQVTVAPLANDYDPNGGVLVITGVTASEDSALSIGVTEHRFVTIKSRLTLTEPEVVTYEIDNGYAKVSGNILVQPTEPSTQQRAPEVKPITATVRTGGVVTIPVLDYATDADGDRISVVQDLPEPLPEDQGLLFVSGDVIRYQAPQDPRTTTTTFSVRDEHGNVSNGQLTILVHESDPEAKQPPSPRNITARAYAGETIRIPIPLTGIDVDGDGVTLLGLGDEAPVQGFISAQGANWLEYTASRTARGTDVFTYAVEDWTGQRSIASVRVGLVEKPEGALPIVATDDEVTVEPGASVEVRVLRNDIDPSGLDLSLQPLPQVEGIIAVVSERRIAVEVPRNAEEKTYAIPYSVTNPVGGTASAVLRVHVSAEAGIAAPIAEDIVVAPTEVVDKQTVEVDVMEVAENPSGPLSDLDLSIPPSHSEAAAVSPGGKVMVTLSSTTQTIPYRLSNRNDSSAYTYAFITVPALGDFPPTVRPKVRELRVASGSEITIPLAEFVQVGPGKTARVLNPQTVTATQSDGSSLVVDDTTLRFVSSPGFSGTASITFEVWDSQTQSESGRSAVLTLPITVFAEEDLPPAFSPTVVRVPQGSDPVSVDLNLFTTPADGAENAQFGFRVASPATSGFVAGIDGSTLNVSAPPELARGTQGSLAVTINYGLAGSTQVTVPFEVVASTKPLASVSNKDVLADAGVSQTVDLLVGAYDPVGLGLRITSVRVLTSGTGTTASVQGNKVAVTPGGDFSGTVRIAATITDGLNDPNRNIEATVNVTVRKVPDAPRTPRVSSPSNRSVTVAWDAPNANGAVITDYRVTAQPGGQVQQCSSTSCTITGLTNGTEYRFTVAARNDVGYSDESPVSSGITPDVLPGAPGTPQLTDGDGQITATWDRASNEGSAIRSYTVEISPGVGDQGVTVREVTGTNTTITGLTNGTSYKVRVRANNSAATEGGAGPWSPMSASATPAGPPSAPSASARLGGSQEIKVSWKLDSTNGAALRNYTVTVLQGGNEVRTVTLDANVTDWSFNRAEDGVDYRFAVRAINRAGTSRPGTTEAISTFSAPNAPNAGSTSVDDNRDYAQGGKITLNWSAPSNTGGANIAITHYEIAGIDQRISGTSYSLDGLTPGQATSTHRVRACNTRGACSDWSTLPSATPLTRPQRPSVSASFTSDFSDFTVTITGRNAGGYSGVSYEYRINGGAWRGANPGDSIDPPGNTESSEQSGQILIEARAKNDSGFSAIESTSLTLRQPNAPTITQINAWWEGAIEMKWTSAPSRGYAVKEYEACWSVRGSTCSNWQRVGGKDADEARMDLADDNKLPEEGSGEFDLHLRAVTNTGNGATTVTGFTYTR